MLPRHRPLQDFEDPLRRARSHGSNPSRPIAAQNPCKGCTPALGTSYPMRRLRHTLTHPYPAIPRALSLPHGGKAQAHPIRPELNSKRTETTSKLRKSEPLFVRINIYDFEMSRLGSTSLSRFSCASCCGVPRSRKLSPAAVVVSAGGDNSSFSPRRKPTTCGHQMGSVQFFMFLGRKPRNPEGVKINIMNGSYGFSRILQDYAPASGASPSPSRSAKSRILPLERLFRTRSA